MRRRGSIRSARMPSAGILLTIGAAPSHAQGTHGERGMSQVEICSPAATVVMALPSREIRPDRCREGAGRGSHGPDWGQPRVWFSPLFAA
jgi:hypothetical protein